MMWLLIIPNDWCVDIISNTDFITLEAEKNKEAGLLIELKGIGEKMVYNLNSFSIFTVKDLASADTDFITQIPGIGKKTAEKLVDMANEFFENREES